MNSKLKVALQIVFLAALIWLMAGLAGGLSVRVGGGGKRHCRGRRRRGRTYTWTNSGMGGTLVATSGSNTPMPLVGLPLTNF